MTMSKQQRTTRSSSSRRHHGDGNQIIPRRSLAEVETSAPHWKDVLRSACIDRARKKKRAIILRKRFQYTTAAAAASTTASDESPLSHSSVRNLLEEELKERGINVVSPGRPTNIDAIVEMPTFQPKSNIIRNHDDPSLRHDDMDTDVDNKQMIRGEGEYEITEEVLNELLQDIEDQIRIDEETFLEEILEAEQNMIMDQVADYESWNDYNVDAATMESEQSASAEEYSVLCPVCQTSNLQFRPDNKIICPQIRCDLCIDAGGIDSDYQNSMNSLRLQLGLAYQEHATYCSGLLSFEVSKDLGCSHLVSRCDHCSLRGFISFS